MLNRVTRAIWAWQSLSFNVCGWTDHGLCRRIGRTGLHKRRRVEKKEGKRNRNWTIPNVMLKEEFSIQGETKLNLLSCIPFCVSS